MTTHPVFLPGKFHRQKRLAGYSLCSRRVGHDWANVCIPQHRKFKNKRIARGYFQRRNLGDGAEEASVFLLSVGYYLSVKPIKMLVGWWYWLRRPFHKCLFICKLLEMGTLNRCSPLYVSQTSVKWLFLKMERGKKNSESKTLIKIFLERRKIRKESDMWARSTVSTKVPCSCEQGQNTSPPAVLLSFPPPTIKKIPVPRRDFCICSYLGQYRSSKLLAQLSTEWRNKDEGWGLKKNSVRTSACELWT